MIKNAKEAHAAGQVWISIKINGGPVKLTHVEGSIGRLEVTGPLSPAEALEIWKLVSK